jgi:hypothetical protein
MMTTSKTYDTSYVQSPNGTRREQTQPAQQQVINEVAPPIISSTPVESLQSTPTSENVKVLNEWIGKFTKGEITEAQLNVIKKTLGFN